MNKIAVLGKGTAGSLTYNHFAFFTNWDIDVYYDSNIEERSVGEGTTIDVVKDLKTINKLDFYNTKELFDATYKTGIYYKNWSDHDYFHTFPMPEMSIHFDAKKLQEYFKKYHEDRINFIDKKIDTYDQVKADHIIDCRGAPKNYDNYYKAKYIPVNSVMLCKVDYDPRFDYTICDAVEYGWIFSIPLKNKISYGYLFNRNITDKEKIKYEFKKYIKKTHNNINEIKNIDFENYYRKDNFTKEITYNGNASFFLEPIEATSLSTVNSINRKLYDYLFNENSLSSLNNWYLKEFNNIQVIINIHYYAKNKFKNSFWEYAKDLSSQCIQENKEDLKQILFFANNNMELDNQYGTWLIHSFKQNFKGLNLYDF